MQFVLVNQPRVLPRKKTYETIKRFLDVLVCLLTLPVVLPVLTVCAIGIRIDDPHGPILLLQDRIGKGGRSFKMLKFRTIKTDLDITQNHKYMQAYIIGDIGKDSDGTQIFKPVPNQKIFRVGRLLRKTSLDELPQIFNVLKGEMSIVGPRPNVPWEVEVYQPWHHERMEVVPGIVGLAQVRGRSSIMFNSLARYDIAYIEKRGLILDLKILWWSLLTILSGKGVR